MFNVPLCPTDANYTPIRQIAPAIKHAVIVSEDSTFYSHQGLDLYELRKTIDENLKEGKIVRGGSTITQQLAKNVYLNGEKSFLRKIREALIAVRLEKILSKDEILERYLNVVEFGPNIYGVKKASQFYFGKAPAQVSVLEGAWLAFVLPNPKKYSQSFRTRQLTKFASSQLKTIIIRMARFGKISADDEQIALGQLESMFQPYVDPNEDLTQEELNAIEQNLEPRQAPVRILPDSAPEPEPQPEAEVPSPQPQSAPPDESDFTAPADEPANDTSSDSESL